MASWNQVGLEEHSHYYSPPVIQPRGSHKKVSKGISEWSITFNGAKVKIQVCPGANPHFHKARPVPFPLRDAVEQELDKLESEGIIANVAISDWAGPIVAVPKKACMETTK